MIRGQETAAKEKSFYQEEEITDKETVSPVDIAGSGQTNGDETAEKEQQIDTVGLKRLVSVWVVRLGNTYLSLAKVAPFSSPR